MYFESKHCYMTLIVITQVIEFSETRRVRWCTDNWECNKTPEHEHIWACILTACVCQRLGWACTTTLADHGNTKAMYWQLKVMILMRVLRFERGDREKASYCQPFSLTMCASSMINFPSLYFWLASNACSYNYRLKCTSIIIIILYFWLWMIDLHISTQELSYKNCSRCQQPRGVPWGECALLLSHNQCSHCHKTNTDRLTLD